MTDITGEARKVAIVFGGSRGIGAAIARRLAADGADVAFTYVSAPERAQETAAAIEASGRAALAIRADSANADEIRQAVARTVERFGRLDVVAVNAGILKTGDVSAVSVEDLDRMLAVNVRGVFLAVQAGAAHLARGGRIVTIGSNVAVRSGYPGSSVYSMTKAAVAVMVKGVAIDLAPRGITINNVQPGPVETDMTADHLDHVRPLIPLQRAGSPDEVAALVSWLASAESAYMTGSSLTIDGGMAL
ncbi:oxidoreductase [Burkholderia pyrrocinia]|uniref:Oxidoreductase n=1 Tax=Burkholderia pyrrocinia TaxID=60550 RepID=A0A2Z5N5E2_BURPY|nr:SDR family oxidoreductase [Burkholderia pyrrocinia]AXF24763.1 oxidoreductase [Burkholderia pyrrocinia]